MKVIWKETIVDKLKAVYDGARRNNKEVECIMLSKREWDELLATVPLHQYIAIAGIDPTIQTEGTFMGMKIKRWEFA